MAERASSPYINHFIQPDAIIPNPANPQSWNRYSYVQNNPIRFIDPTGHFSVDNDAGTSLDDECVAADGGTMPCWIYPENHPKAGQVIPRPKTHIQSDDATPYWDVGRDLENCAGSWDCIVTIVNWYYDDLGYPLDQLAMNPPFQNPLGPNELYFMEPSILMEMQSSENTRLLQILSVDYSYPYNYEPVYLETLRSTYPELNNVVENESNWFSESGIAAHEFIYNPGGYSWVTKFASGWENALWQLNKVRYMPIVIYGD